MTKITTTIIINAVTAPGRCLISEARRRSMGLLVVILASTPTQNGPTYNTEASIGAFIKAGRVNLNATRQNPYATNNAGRNAPNATSSGGGFDWGSEKRVMCQNPMQTRHQNRTSALGLRRKKRIHVTKILNARAELRRSVQ